MLLEIIPNKDTTNCFLLDVSSLSMTCDKNEHNEHVCKLFISAGLGFCYTFDSAEKMAMFKHVLLETLKYGELVGNETEYTFKLHRLKGECL